MNSLVWKTWCQRYFIANDIWYHIIFSFWLFQLFTDSAYRNWELKTLQYCIHREILHAFSDAKIVFGYSFSFHVYVFLLVPVQENQIDNGFISKIVTQA